MSTLVAKNTQIGSSGTANQNFTLYQPSTPDGTVRLGVGNSGATTSDVLTINNSGNVGVGVTPSASSIKTLEIGAAGNALMSTGGNQTILSANAYYNAGWKYGTTATANYYMMSGGEHRWYTAPSGTAGNPITFTQAMTLTAGGYLGVGTTLPSYEFVVAKSGSFGLEFGPAYAGSRNLIQAYNRTSSTYGDIDFAGASFKWLLNGATSAMTLDASGNLLVGTTTYSAAGISISKPDGSGCYSILSGAAGGNHWRFGNMTNGSVGSIQTTATSTSYNTTSDHRLKENARPADAKRFMDIEFVDFEWVDGRHDCGVIAHQLQSVYPDLVLGEKDAVDADGNPVYQQVNYTGLIGRMGARVQQLQRTVDSQATIIEQLTANQQLLEARIAALEAK